MEPISDAEIKALFNEYILESKGIDCVDCWKIAAKVINKLAPRVNYTTDSEYFHDVTYIWNRVYIFVEDYYSWG